MSDLCRHGRTPGLCPSMQCMAKEMRRITAPLPEERGVDATCRDCGKVQRTFLPHHTREQAAGLAGIMDGSSPLYAHPPGDDSFIGECGICGGRFDCTIFGYPETEAPTT